MHDKKRRMFDHADLTNSYRENFETHMKLWCTILIWNLAQNLTAITKLHLTEVQDWQTSILQFISKLFFEI